MAGQRISDLTAGTPPYDTASLLEVSVPAGAGAFNTRKALLSDLIPVGSGGGLPLTGGNLTGLLDISVASGSALTLHNATTTDGPYVTFTSATQTYRLGMGNQPGPTNLTNDFYIYDVLTSKDRLVINQSGNIGFGIPDPNAKIHAVGAAGQSALMQLCTSDYVSGTTGSVAFIGFGAASGNTYTDLGAFSAGGAASNNLALQRYGGTVAIGAVPNTVARLQVTAASGSVQPAIFNTNDFTGSVGSSLIINFGAGTGNTYSVIRARTDGITSNGDIIFNPAGGNVGIGTTVAPNARFQVYGGSNTTPVQIVTSDFNLGSAGSTLALGFGATTGDTYSSLQAMRGGNVYSTDLVLNSGAGGGNVGIGITTPTHKLHVKTLTGQTDAALFANSSWTSGVTGTSLQISFGASAGNTYANIRPFLSGNTANGDMVLQGGANVGRVSIGGLIPLSRFHVTAEQAGTGNSVFTTYDWVSGSVGSAFTIGFGAASGNTNTALSAYTTGGNVTGDLVLNPGGGNVGIGTAGPGFKLEVNGPIVQSPGTTVTPTVNGQVTVSATSNTSLTFRLKGSDGTVRSASLTLA